MMDVAKVADLALLLVDATFGFEMETFEFLNICQVGKYFYEEINSCSFFDQTSVENANLFRAPTCKIKFLLVI